MACVESRGLRLRWMLYETTLSGRGGRFLLLLLFLMRSLLFCRGIRQCLKCFFGDDRCIRSVAGVNGGRGLMLNFAFLKLFQVVEARLDVVRVVVDVQESYGQLVRGRHKTVDGFAYLDGIMKDSVYQCDFDQSNNQLSPCRRLSRCLRGKLHSDEVHRGAVSRQI